MKLFQTSFDQDDLKPVYDILQNCDIGFGKNVDIFEQKFSSYSGKKFNIATNSASAAAFMIFALLKERHGTCNVYTTPLGFISPIWTAKHLGHRVIFVDVDENLMMCSKDYLQKRKTYGIKDQKTVVMPVLYGGLSNIEGWTLKGDEIVIVDSAHCANPTIDYDFSFFSFHPYKPICTSDGGMISTNDLEADTFFRLYRNFGRSANQTSYNVVQNGFKFYMNNLNATLGLISLKKYQRNLESRKRNFEIIKNHVKVDKVIKHDKKSSYYFATMFCDNADLKLKKMSITRHYPLLHKTKYFENEYRGKLNNIEDLFDKFINVPIHENLTYENTREIIRIVNE